MNRGQEKALRDRVARRRPARTAARHAFLVVVHGGAATFASYQLSQIGQGLPQAGLFVLAASIAVVTVGLTVAIGVAALDDAGSARSRVAAQPCHSCDGALVRLGSAWVCPTCDRLPLRSP